MARNQFDKIPARFTRRTDAEEARTMLRMIGSALAIMALLAMAACNSVTGVSEQANKQELTEPPGGGGGIQPPEDPTSARDGSAERGEYSEPNAEPGVSKMELNDPGPGGGGGQQRPAPPRDYRERSAGRGQEIAPS
jgi:hypothetical protein